MTEPTTVNIGLIVPNTGDLVGAWGTAALNVNLSALDGYVGGVLSLSLGAATTITLTTASATLTPGAGPYQSANSIIELSGTLSGNAVFAITQPGVYRFYNGCTVGTNYVQIKPVSGTGLAVGIPDGELWHVHFDGTNCRLIGLPHVGQLIDLCVATTPAWMNAFSVAPYLLCNGGIYSVAPYPTLATRLGSTFGGNGITTFGVPDYQNRYFIPIDFGGNLRITVASSGIDGTAFGATGGSQNLQSHSHASPAVTDPGHQHGYSQGLGNAGSPGGGGNAGSLVNGTTTVATTGITLAANVGTTGGGSSGNIPPAIVGGLRMIKT